MNNGWYCITYHQECKDIIFIIRPYRTRRIFFDIAYLQRKHAVVETNTARQGFIQRQEVFISTPPSTV